MKSKQTVTNRKMAWFKFYKKINYKWGSQGKHPGGSDRLRGGSEKMCLTWF